MLKSPRIKGSINIPLFSDEERSNIGTAYKQISSEEAIKLGESYAEPKIPSYLKSVDIVASDSPIIIICFRGGMRSRRFARLLDENGYDVYRLSGGYKSFRTYINQLFSNPLSLNVLGGMTGTGKTEILQELEKTGEQIIDLEQIANHRGSAFGAIGQEEQPTTEQFENNLFEIIFTINKSDRIWIEDESRNIGKVFLPELFFEQLRTAPLIILELDKKERAKRLSRDYGSGGDNLLKESIEKISRRLGGEKSKIAVEAIDSKDYYKAALIILDYYDKSYLHNFDKKKNIKINRLILDTDNPINTAELLKREKFIK